MEKHKYVIVCMDYVGEEPGMYEFEGTFRELLLDLMGDDEECPQTITDEELTEQFNRGNNGCGQPYMMVWDVDLKKKVLG